MVSSSTVYLLDFGPKAPSLPPEFGLSFITCFVLTSLDNLKLLSPNQTSSQNLNSSDIKVITMKNSTQDPFEQYY